MCGLAGIAAIDPRQPLDTARLESMLACVAHRGPDGGGAYVAPGIALGHRRLAVIDLEGGRQPISGADERTMVVTNGEIYNYRELRRELESRGHRFRTASDAEVVAQGYDAWGLGVLDRLDGMFGLAVWDGRLHRLVLARDRAGEKPLYWARAGGTLIFGSELTAVLAHGAVGRRVDAESLSQYLALDYVPAPRSIVQGVQKLEPATALVLEGGDIRIERYWTIDLTPLTPRPEYRDAVADLRGRLERAVESRLVSDVPVGVLLSGGVDSTAVAALAARERRVVTFSVAFDEPTFDERRWSRTAAQAIGSDHHELVLAGSDLLPAAATLGALLDEPLGDASILPTAALSRFARDHVTVVLGGDGGDEVFAGYPTYAAHRVAATVGRIPGAAMAARVVARLSPVSHDDFSLGFKARTFARGVAAQPPMNHALWMSSWPPGEQQRLLTDAAWRDASQGRSAFAGLEQAWRDSNGASPLVRQTHLDTTCYLANDVLAKVDRASMAVGLEVRAPLLAREILDVAFRLPDSYRLKGSLGKRILRDAVGDIVPPAIVRRRKKGFGIPVAAWINGPFRELVDETLAPSRLEAGGAFRSAVVTSMLAEHRAGRADHRKPLWTLLAFELWRRAKLG